MRILNLKQGEPSWHAHRRWPTKNASDAPAALGESPHCSRSELLHRMATGITPDVDGATQARFNDGHAVEALLRPVAEQHLGEPLHPFVGVADFDEHLSASFDGCTFVGDVTLECKLLNARLRAAFADMETIAPEHRERSAASCLPIDYRIQMEQQLRVAEAERCLFMTGELRDDGTLGDTFSCWYYPDDALWKRIQAGWEQFAADLATYTPPAATAVEKIVAEPVEALPAPVVQVSGQLTLQDNFKVFEERLRHFLEHRLIREPKTDEDFVNLDAQIKAMKQARKALEAAEAQMLAQVQPVDQAKKTKDMLDTLLQQNCSMAERLMNSEKERRRGEIIVGGVKALADHVRKLDERLQPVFSRVGVHYMPTIPADFGGCIKGLKSLASMEDKVSTELARAKIAANEVADRIQANLEALRELAAEHAFLFADTATLVLKAPDDCRAVITSRIAEHRAAEERRLEAERSRIRAEEEERARQQQERRAKVQERIDAIVTAGAGVTESGRIAGAIRTLQSCTLTAELLDDRVEEAARARVTRLQELEIAHAEALEREAAARRQSEAAQRAAAPTPTQPPAAAPIATPAVSSQPVNVVPMQRPTPAPQTPPSLKLGEINRRLAPLSITAEGLAQMGFPVVATERAAKLYHESNWIAMVDAMTAHLEEDVRGGAWKAA